MAACRADMILLGGDYADRREQALRLFDAFRELHAPLGIYGVAGNNDIEAFGSLDALGEAMRAFGGTLLVNRGETIALGGGRAAAGGRGRIPLWRAIVQGPVHRGGWLPRPAVPLSDPAREAPRPT